MTTHPATVQYDTDAKQWVLTVRGTKKYFGSSRGEAIDKCMSRLPEHHTIKLL